MKTKKVDEYGYIEKYSNMSYGRDIEMYNDLMKKMEAVYCRWYGSAYGLTSLVIARLKEKIKKGETTWTAWKREFDDKNYKAITGHTLTEEKQIKKEKQEKLRKNIKAIETKIVLGETLTEDEKNTLSDYLNHCR